MQNLLLLRNQVDLLQVSWKRVLYLSDQEKHLISEKYPQIQDLIMLITGLCIDMKDPGAFSAKRKLDGVAQSVKRAYV